MPFFLSLLWSTSSALDSYLTATAHRSQVQRPTVNIYCFRVPPSETTHQNLVTAYCHWWHLMSTAQRLLTQILVADREDGKEKDDSEQSMKHRVVACENALRWTSTLRTISCPSVILTDQIPPGICAFCPHKSPIKACIPAAIASFIDRDSSCWNTCDEYGTISNYPLPPRTVRCGLTLCPIDAPLTIAHKIIIGH